MTTIKQVTINEALIELYQITEDGDFYLQVVKGQHSRPEGQFDTFKQAEKAYKNLVLSYL